MINREIKDLQPDYYSGIYEFDKIAHAEEQSIGQFDDYLLEQLNNLYVTQSDEKGIKNFERAYHIEASDNDSLKTRRRRIVSRLLPPQAITFPFLKKMLQSLSLDVESKVDCINSIYSAIVDFDKFSDDQIDELNGLINDYLPAHLSKKIYRYQHGESDLGNYMGIANTVTFYSHADANY